MNVIKQDITIILNEQKYKGEVALNTELVLKSQNGIKRNDFTITCSTCGTLGPVANGKLSCGHQFHCRSCGQYVTVSGSLFSCGHQAVDRHNKKISLGADLDKINLIESNYDKIYTCEITSLSTKCTLFLTIKEEGKMAIYSNDYTFNETSIQIEFTRRIVSTDELI